MALQKGRVDRGRDGKGGKGVMSAKGLRGDQRRSGSRSGARSEYFGEHGNVGPGMLHIAPDAAAPEIALTDYDAKKCDRVSCVSPRDVVAYLDQDSVTWVDVKGLGHAQTLEEMGEVFRLHPLLLEDIVNVPQRPKVEEMEDQILVIARMVTLRGTPSHHWEHSGDDPSWGEQDFLTEQVSFVLGEHYLLSVQEEPKYDCFEGVRERLEAGKGAIRKLGADYLLYALLDAIVDGFFPVLEVYGERLEMLEDEVVRNPSSQTLEKIHAMKRELITLRRAIWPQRDVINSLIRDGNGLIGDEVRVYLRDCYDHAIQVLDMVEMYREVASSLMDVYLSSVGNRMNEIMKFLTVMSSVFIPLTFIAGVYGMNFITEKSRWNMPELNWEWGYAVCIGMMAGIAVSLLVVFWRKGWFDDYSGQVRGRGRR